MYTLNNLSLGHVTKETAIGSEWEVDWNGFFCVPTTEVSVLDLTVRTMKVAYYDDIKAAIK